MTAETAETTKITAEMEEALSEETVIETLDTNEAMDPETEVGTDTAGGNPALRSVEETGLWPEPDLETTEVSAGRG